MTISILLWTGDFKQTNKLILLNLKIQINQLIFKQDSRNFQCSFLATFPLLKGGKTKAVFTSKIYDCHDREHFFKPSLIQNNFANLSSGQFLIYIYLFLAGSLMIYSGCIMIDKSNQKGREDAVDAIANWLDKHDKIKPEEDKLQRRLAISAEGRVANGSGKLC